ncbi:MAG: hypothetical protein J3K34DRAFT_140720 [Monoraphidium minutum]|nr:MAG: hypothetical protein J3K34DRAFT_140720 [Monoraphidium minutum]
MRRWARKGFGCNRKRQDWAAAATARAVAQAPQRPQQRGPLRARARAAHEGGRAARRGAGGGGKRGMDGMIGAPPAAGGSWRRPALSKGQPRGEHRSSNLCMYAAQSRACARACAPARQPRGNRAPAGPAAAVAPPPPAASGAGVGAPVGAPALGAQRRGGAATGLAPAGSAAVRGLPGATTGSGRLGAPHVRELMRIQAPRALSVSCCSGRHPRYVIYVQAIRGQHLGRCGARGCVGGGGGGGAVSVRLRWAPARGRAGPADQGWAAGEAGAGVAEGPPGLLCAAGPPAHRRAARPQISAARRGRRAGPP